MPIKKDRDLQYFFNPMTGYVSIDIFVQAEKIREMVVPDDPAVSEWGTYMSMLTQELSSVPVVTQSMGRFGINDDYPGPSSYASPSDYAGPSSFAGPSDYAGPSSFAGPSDYAGTSSPAGPSVSSEQYDEPEADSYASEVPADSIDIPTGAWGNFYDSNTGELARGMVFKSKDHLKASVQDFSVRFARREYRVVESKPKLWKVACKYDEQTGCSWMLRGIFQPNMGLFKITKSSQWLDQCNQLRSGIQISSWVHRFCLRHVCSNFNKKFNNIRLKDLCWRAGAEVNARKFERIMTEIRELNEEAYNWLEMIDKTQWTLSHDSGWRTGILTTNMSECVNGVLRGARCLPIVAIVQITFHRSVRYFLERTTRCHRMLNANQEWADFAFRIFEARQTEAVHHIVQKFDYKQSASVLTLSLTGQGSHTYVVKLKHKTCSCGKWGTHGIPCSHAIQVSDIFGVNASNFIPQYYSIRAYIERHIKGGLSHCMGKSIGIPLTLNLCIIRRSEFAEDQADMFRCGYQMKWIDHKHVLANNINLVKFRINVITL
ncbi:hypothetical protein Sango_2463700 [Sesamum angolense]|uniref:SWIM-type domain-containing protein n=1 Tax=Sesamum angolense TaxID=2727404 RepID=A0AAE1W8A1_9LAMI|nr:hypothetical protein Sango_2463700 [Sesamum angolense]